MALALPGRLRRAVKDRSHHLRRVLMRLRIVPPPLKVRVSVTDRCNFSCPTCSLGGNTVAAGELTAAEWGAVFRKLARVPLRREITFGGGESLVRRDLPEIITLARSAGFDVALLTNGSTLARETLRRLAEAGVGRVIISLNSLDAALHDVSRGRPGSHARILTALAAWEADGRRPAILLATIVTESNCGELVDLARFAHERGLAGIAFQALAPVAAHYPSSRMDRMPSPPPDWHLHEALWVKRLDVLERSVGELVRRRRRGLPVANPAWQLRAFVDYYREPALALAIPCVAAVTTLSVDAAGRMRLCTGLPPVGSALTGDLAHLWRSPAAAATRCAARHCRELCRLLNSNV